MKKKKPLIKALAVFLTLLLGAPPGLMAQSAGEAPQSAGKAPQEAKVQDAAEAPQGAGEENPFKQEELDQLLAPIALYPDSLLT